MDVGTPLPLPSRNDAVFDFLKTRRSNLAKVMDGPGPSETELAEILEIGKRVPDHRKLAPWRFIIFRGEARAAFGQHLGRAFQTEFPQMPADRVEFETNRFLRAPVVVAVISSPKDCPRGTPEWEQILSCGATCYNILLAAQAKGFGAQWLTEWYAYNADIAKALGLTEAEKVAGFIYLGTPKDQPLERARPEPGALIETWVSEM